MDTRKLLLQIRLSTLLLLTLVVALVIVLIANRMHYDSKIEALEQQVEVFNRHLPEYNLALETHRLNSELNEAKEYYGPDHPIVRKLETQIVALERRKKSEAIHANMGK